MTLLQDPDLPLAEESDVSTLPDTSIVDPMLLFQWVRGDVKIGAHWSLTEFNNNEPRSGHTNWLTYRISKFGNIGRANPASVVEDSTMFTVDLYVSNAESTPTLTWIPNNPEIPPMARIRTVELAGLVFQQVGVFATCYASSKDTDPWVTLTTSYAPLEPSRFLSPESYGKPDIAMPEPDPIDSYIDRFLSLQQQLIAPLRESVGLLRAAGLFSFATYNVDGILTIKALPDLRTELFIEIESDGAIEAGSINDDFETEELEVSRLEDLPGVLQAKYRL